MSERTDSQRIDGLQKLLGRYTGKVACKWSDTDRGWRLYETSRPDAVCDVRAAIDSFLDCDKSRRVLLGRGRVPWNNGLTKSDIDRMYRERARALCDSILGMDGASEKDRSEILARITAS